MVRMRARMVIPGALLALGCNQLSGADGFGLGEETADGSATPATRPLTCNYPASGYGTDEGDIVPMLSWSAVRPGADALDDIHVSELYNCDGYDNQNAVVFLTHRPG